MDGFHLSMEPKRAGVRPLLDADGRTTEVADMAGFRSLARQVRDPLGDLALRRYSLRKCLERFAPYGHRATWDHLCARHGIDPEDRAPDPARLLGALEELEEARGIWLAYEAGFAERRRREKPRACGGPALRRLAPPDVGRPRGGPLRGPGGPPQRAARRGAAPADRGARLRARLRLPGLCGHRDRVATGAGARARAVVGSGVHGVRDRGAAAGADGPHAGQGPAGTAPEARRGGSGVGLRAPGTRPGPCQWRMSPSGT